MKERKKIPYFIYVKDESIFSMAGIYDEWLDPSLDKFGIESFLKPFPAGQMDAYIIDNDFLKKKSDDPTILKKAS